VNLRSRVRGLRKDFEERARQKVPKVAGSETMATRERGRGGERRARAWAQGAAAAAVARARWRGRDGWTRWQRKLGRGSGEVCWLGEGRAAAMARRRSGSRRKQ
jgi:hypothetical protein